MESVVGTDLGLQALLGDLTHWCAYNMTRLNELHPTMNGRPLYDQQIAAQAASNLEAAAKAGRPCEPPVPHLRMWPALIIINILLFWGGALAVRHMSLRRPYVEPWAHQSAPPPAPTPPRSFSWMRDWCGAMPVFLGVGFHRPHLPFAAPIEFHDALPDASEMPPPKYNKVPHGSPL